MVTKEQKSGLRYTRWLVKLFSLLYKNRNPGISEEELSKKLKERM
jgi:Fe2+ or Zn2+ uptake regulation protein